MNMKKNYNQALQSGLAGGLLSCVVAGLLNYYFIPFPKNILGNAIGHSIGGFFSGFMSGFIGVLIYVYQHTHQRN